MQDFNELVSLCRGRKIYIQTHNFPDPDAIASAFGLQKLFEHFGIENEICYAGRIDKLSASRMTQELGIHMTTYRNLRRRVHGSIQEEDWIICVDSQKHAGNITDFIGDEVACIDHHPVYVEPHYRYADLRITGACSTIITDYFMRLGLTPDRDTATALLYGLRMDTLQFSRGVTELDIAAFAFLHPLCDHELLSDLERNSLEFQDLKAYGAAIENVELYDKCGFSHIPFPCADALVAMLADFILSLQEVEVAVVSSQREDGVKISVRSEDPKVHAGHLARAAMEGLGDGGGHATMAAGLIPTENVPKRYLKNQIRKRFLMALGTLESGEGQEE